MGVEPWIIDLESNHLQAHLWKFWAER